MDQPPWGLTMGKPSSSCRIVSRRFCHSALAAAISASGACRATVAAAWAMPTGQTTLEILTKPISSIMAGGATIQPIRQPIIRYSLDTAPTVIVRWAMPENEAGCIYSRPSNRMRSMALSYSSQASASRQAAQMLSQSWRVQTAPVGMAGLIISRTFVLAVTA